MAAILIYKSVQAIDKRVQNLFFASTLSLFAGSTLFHMSGTFMGRMADVSTMFFLAMVILTLSVERYFNLKKRQANLFFTLGLIISLISLFIFQIGSPLFAAEIFAATLLELRMSKTPKALQMKKVGWSLLSILTAFTFWILDVKKVFCIPDNHILTGHAIWHLLAATAIWLYYQSYETKKETRPF
jgi:hypothetical protein